MSSDLEVPPPGKTPAILPPVEIPAFSGPLDLLLHLIRKNEVSITDIPILEITQQYNAYLDLMRELDLDIAAEYIYMAALLIHIKSRTLLPQDPNVPGEDPRQELVERLLEYERFKRAAESFHEIDTVRAGMWSRPEQAPPAGEEGPTLADVSLVDLVGVFRDVLERFRMAHPASIELTHPRFSLKAKMLELFTRLEESGTLPLRELLGGFRYRAEAVTTFLAALELARLTVLRLYQTAAFGEIHATRTDTPFDPAQIQDQYHE